MITRGTIAIDMRLIGLIFALAALAGAQAVDGVNVSVTRVINIAPDQAEFYAVAAVSLDITPQQVVAAFQELGIPNPTVTGVAVGANTYSYPPPDGSQSYFQIYFTAAPSAMKDLAKKLDAFRAKLPEGYTSVQFAAALTASQAALDAARQTALPLLIGDARSRAQTLASAAGVKLGAIVGLAESYYGSPGAVSAWFQVTSAVYASSGSSTTGQYTFFVNVKFATQ
jgi:hypothetical protein